MDEPVMVAERAEDEMDLPEAGSTFAFGVDGWEALDYMDPGDDWTVLPDGSYVSPDGLIRTWLPSAPQEA